MAGYSGYSMSNNAIDAYDKGEKPLSKWTKSSILAAIESAGFNAERFSDLSIDALKNLVLVRCSKHHTSCRYNVTDFYAIDEYRLVEGITDQEIADALKTEKPAEVSYRADVRWLTWGGTKSHPKAIEHRAEGIEVVEKGAFYTFKLPDGDLRKKIGSNGTEVIKK
jgi:hypothetical protein